MKKLAVVQGSLEWFQARMGIPTASEMDALVTPLWKIRTGDGVESYLARKLAEKWRGAPLPTWSGGAAEQGNLKEEEAIPWYEFEFGETIERVGFITTDDDTAGCSPDGMLNDVCGIEIKCPGPEMHCRYLLNGGLPKEYAAQVQASMAVTKAPWWKFLSYCRDWPPLLLTVPLDVVAQKALGQAIATFNERLAVGYKRLVELNGGAPPVRVAPTSPTDESLEAFVARMRGAKCD